VDLYKAIRTLYEEKKRLDKLIESITELKARGVALPPTRPRRSRRKMTAAERRQVSDRMKRYWAARRKANGAQTESRAASPALTS